MLFSFQALEVIDFQFESVVIEEYILYYLHSFKFLLNLGLLYGLGCGLSWSVCHGHLKRMCVLLLFGDIIYKWRLYPVG